ncbi:MAG: hypothetical protein JRG89_03680 [Deltaproteobacteria bacterium]|nr:hypothetical protein [Deltaproteobacteria bacterium]
MRTNGIRSIALALLGSMWVGSAWGQLPDHPVITEVYQEPPFGGGPVGRDPADPHQEFLEIYLPSLADLAPGLDKDALNVTFYDVEGDATSPGLALVNYRIDLPTFDLDPSNGLTGLPRPASGVVVLGWVDYVGNPPTDLAGTPSSRIALIDGGVTSTSGFTFIAINGGQFGGTTNFPIPAAVSHIDTVSDPLTGKIEQGSGVFLLVNRDDPGFVSLCGQTDPGSCSSFPNLAAGTTLGTSSLFDAFAANDDADFRVDEQPYAAPTGDNIDLEFVLPLGGAFSLLAPQVEEQANGYQRLLLDIVKTTEDGVAGNEDPALDAVNTYITVSNLGPFYPTPGRAPSTTSPAIFSLADASLQTIEVLTNTNARPGLNAANLGGDFGIDTLTTPGVTVDPSAMTITQAAASFLPLGQISIAPPVEVQTFVTTPGGHTEVVSVQVDASASGVGDPPVVNPTDSVTATFVAIDPTTGIDAMGLPFQATAFFAVQGIPSDAGVANEFVGTSLGQAMTTGLGTTFSDVRGNGAALINPLTDLSDPLIVDPMIATIPTDPLFFINPPSASSDLVTTVLGSAEVVSGAATYADSFNLGQTLVQAREFLIGDVPTTGGFTPQERIHYANSSGFPGRPTSGLTDVLTGRDFELALIDTNLGPTGLIETGATDDFGIVVRVAQTGVGASVASGEFVFLSTTGGREGADIDTLDVPPHGNLMGIIYVDLDPLDTVLGVESIDRLYVVDGSGNGEVDVIEVIGAGILTLCARRRRGRGVHRSHRYST